MLIAQKSSTQGWDGASMPTATPVAALLASNSSRGAEASEVFHYATGIVCRFPGIDVRHILSISPASMIAPRRRFAPRLNTNFVEQGAI
jgi:hypothetical protein